jgi:hypothetical protein
MLSSTSRENGTWLCCGRNTHIPKTLGDAVDEWQRRNSQ